MATYIFLSENEGGGSTLLLSAIMLTLKQYMLKITILLQNCVSSKSQDFSKMLIENLRKLSEKNAFRLTGQRAQCLADISS